MVFACGSPKQCQIAANRRAVACEIVLCRALAIRIISVGWPFNVVTTEYRANTKRAFGCEKRAKTRPVITARKDMPVKISTVATRWP